MRNVKKKKKADTVHEFTLQKFPPTPLFFQLSLTQHWEQSAVMSAM